MQLGFPALFRSTATLTRIRLSTFPRNGLDSLQIARRRRSCGEWIGGLAERPLHPTVNSATCVDERTQQEDNMRKSIVIAAALLAAPVTAVAATTTTADNGTTTYTTEREDDDNDFPWGLLGLLGLAGLLGRKKRDSDIHVDARRDTRP
jgi:MYXO-CTERM domain-containing protein